MQPLTIKKAKKIIRDGNIPNKKFNTQCGLKKQAISMLRHHEISIHSLSAKTVIKLAHFYDKCKRRNKL